MRTRPFTLDPIPRSRTSRRAALHRPCYEHRFGEPGSVVHERSTALRNSAEDNLMVEGWSGRLLLCVNAMTDIAALHEDKQ
jgi:hypothetical protein